MDFGSALTALKAGRRVTRTDTWVSGVFLILVPGSTFTVEAGRPLGNAAPDMIGQHIQYEPHIDMCCTGLMFHARPAVTPWSAADEDLLADDWAEVAG